MGGLGDKLSATVRRNVISGMPPAGEFDMGYGSLRRAAGCVALMAVLVAGGCGRPSSRVPEVRYGVEHNPQRRQAGLPLVNPGWSTASIDDQTLVWTAPGGAQRGASSHFSKLVVYDRGEVLEEVDFYTNGHPYVLDVPGTGRVPRMESMVIHYNYEKAARGAPPWSCALTRGNTDEEMSLPDAEQVLAGWGLHRVE
jgi:hypothetical protein